MNVKNNIIKTQRLKLKKIKESDFDNLVKLFSDPDVMKYSVSGAFSKEKVREILNNMLKDDNEKNLGVYVVFDKKNDLWMGIVGVAWIEKNKVALVYRFFKEFWEKGYATEALQAFLKYISTNFSSVEVFAYIEEENKSSIKVAKKVGMQFQGKTIFHGIDVFSFKLI